MGIGKTIGKATVTGLLCGGLVTGAGSAYGNERFNNFAAGVAREMIHSGVDQATRNRINREDRGGGNIALYGPSSNGNNRGNIALYGPSSNGNNYTRSIDRGRAVKSHRNSPREVSNDEHIIEQIRKMPRIVYRGYIDDDDFPELDFCKPGINDCYPARRWFGNSDETSWGNFKSGEFYKERFFYWENGERKPVPRDTLIIWYHRPGMNPD